MGRQCEALRVRHMQLEEGGGVFSDVRKKNYNRGERSFFEPFFKRKKTTTSNKKPRIGFHSEKKNVFCSFFLREGWCFYAPKNQVPTP